MVGESSGEEAVGEWQGLEDAFPELPELAPRKILRALRLLLKLGLVELVPYEACLVPQITEEGGKRLDSIFPVYNEKRPWDGKFYLVNYDIPVGKNSQRDALRNFLKSIGCVMLQSSVWLTPYNPVKALKDFAEKRKLSEKVLVSVLLEEFAPPVAEIYGLEEINQRYREFVERMTPLRPPSLLSELREGFAGQDKMQLAFDYFSILKDDPQLPFELLPKDWMGDRAQELFEKLFFEK